MAVQSYQLNGLRETEAIPFFRNNMIATPVRITSFNPVSSSRQPKIVKNYLQTPNVGKPINDVPVLDTYDFGSYNLSVN